MRLNHITDRFTRFLTERQHNLRSFSMLRILYGIGLLFLLVPSARERSILWGKASFWVDPEARRRGFETFDLLLPKGSPLLFDLGYFLLLALVILFTIGCYTRIVLPVMLVMLVSLQANNPYMLNGGDTLMRITLLFMLFANLSEYYSIDALRRKRRREVGRPRSRVVPRHVSNAAHNVGLVLCCFQIIVVYVASGVWKLTGSEWLEGTALFYSLRLDAFTVFPLINEMIWQSSLMIYVATFLALWVQTLFPAFLVWRPSRVFALVSLMFMHFSIGLLLGLWPFSLAMIALDMLYVRDSTWVSIGERVRRSALWEKVSARWSALQKREPVAEALGEGPGRSLSR